MQSPILTPRTPQPPIFWLRWLAASVLGALPGLLLVLAGIAWLSALTVPSWARFFLLLPGLGVGLGLGLGQYWAATGRLGPAWPLLTTIGFTLQWFTCIWLTDWCAPYLAGGRTLWLILLATGLSSGAYLLWPQHLYLSGRAEQLTSDMSYLTLGIAALPFIGLWHVLSGAATWALLPLYTLALAVAVLMQIAVLGFALAGVMTRKAA